MRTVSHNIFPDLTLCMYVKLVSLVQRVYYRDQLDLKESINNNDNKLTIIASLLGGVGNGKLTTLSMLMS